jgi:hypothetical protein
MAANIAAMIAARPQAAAGLMVSEAPEAAMSSGEGVSPAARAAARGSPPGSAAAMAMALTGGRRDRAPGSGG